MAFIFARSSRLMFRQCSSRLFSISSIRMNSNEQRPMMLMDLPRVVYPNVFLTIKNFFSRILINGYFDSQFAIQPFSEGARQALMTVSKLIADGQFDDLASFVTPDVLSEVKRNFENLSSEQKQKIPVEESEIVFTYPYLIGIIMDDQASKRLVEISMIFHVLKNREAYREEMMQSNDSTTSKLATAMKIMRENIVVCNYKFLRDMSKNAEDESWTISGLNHWSPNRMRFEDLPTELIFDIFSYFHPAELYRIILPLRHSRFSQLLSQIRLSIDLTGASFSQFVLLNEKCSPTQIVFLRLSNQFSHGFSIREFFSSNSFSPLNFDRLHSLHLDDLIGNEIDCLPSNLQKLFVKFHKKAAHASQFYRLALSSKTLKECFLIGGYAFDHQTCFPIFSPTIEHLHMAMKSFPTDLVVVLQSLPSLIKLKTRVYHQSTVTNSSMTTKWPLRHLNIDLQGSGINLNLLDQNLLNRFNDLKSLIYHSYGKSTSNETDEFLRLSKRFQRVQFIRKGLTSYTDLLSSDPSIELVMGVQELTNQKNSRQSMILHTIPYPDKVLHLPFLHWNKVQYADDFRRRSLYLEIYDRVERVRINLSERCLSSDFPTCRHVKQLILMSNNDQQTCLVTPINLSSLIHLSSVEHLILNTSLSLVHFHSVFLSMSLETLDISWSQLRSFISIGNIKKLSLIRECVSWKEIEYLIYQFLPQLEHLQMNVTTSDECRLILNCLLSRERVNVLRSLKICICQTLSDQIQQDLQPLLVSSEWISVKWRMDNWYLYIWK